MIWRQHNDFLKDDYEQAKKSLEASNLIDTVC